jgi:hypothetical protein
MALGVGIQQASQFSRRSADPRGENDACSVFSPGGGVILAVLGVLVLAGCGGSPTADSAASPTPVAAKPVARTTSTPAKPTLPYVRKVEKEGGGVAGIALHGTKAPAIQPAVPGKAPRMVPVPGVPTPIQPPRGQAATPGKRATRSTVVIRKPGGGTMTIRATGVKVAKPMPSPSP